MLSIVLRLGFFAACLLSPGGSSYVDVLEVFKSLPEVPVQQSFVGPNLKWENNSMSFVCKDLFLHIINHEKDIIPWPPLSFKDLLLRPELMEALSLNGNVKIADWYFQEKENGAAKVQWTNESIREWANKDSKCGHYNWPQCEDFFVKHKNLIKGSRGMVVGSQNPWAEARLLKIGASHVVTAEYLEIETSYPGLSVVRPTILFHLTVD